MNGLISGLVEADAVAIIYTVSAFQKILLYIYVIVFHYFIGGIAATSQPSAGFRRASGGNFLISASGINKLSASPVIPDIAAIS